MANIYLRLPLYLAEFYRGRNPKIQLGRDDVFCFPPQSEEWNIIRNGCAIMEPLKQRDRPCYRDWETDRKSTRLNSSHSAKSRMPSSA